MRSSLVLAVALAVGSVGLSAMPEADAQNRRAARQMAEGSMVLTGQIDIGTEGQVEAFALDNRDKVATELAEFVERQVQGWRFEPIIRDGQAVRARTYASIRMVAKADTDGRDLVRIQAANFDRFDPAATDSVTKLTMDRPKFPLRAAEMGGRGEVLMLLQIGRDGTVMDAVAEQVNLRVLGDERQMKRLRDLFADESVRTARQWTFRPPTTGRSVDAPYWSVRVPIRFDEPSTRAAYGQWDVYIPGPRTQAPWRARQVDGRDVAGLLTNGGVYMADVSTGPRLLTKLGG